jgi:hypothetical protein
MEKIRSEGSRKDAKNRREGAKESVVGRRKH